MVTGDIMGRLQNNLSFKDAYNVYSEFFNER